MLEDERFTVYEDVERQNFNSVSICGLQGQSNRGILR